jgi:hypothetical protein
MWVTWRKQRYLRANPRRSVESRRFIGLQAPLLDVGG